MPASPEQTGVGPAITGVGFGLTVTAKGAVVTLQEDGAVSFTVKVPEVVQVTLTLLVPCPELITPPPVMVHKNVSPAAGVL